MIPAARVSGLLVALFLGSCAEPTGIGATGEFNGGGSAAVSGLANPAATFCEDSGHSLVREKTGAGRVEMYCGDV